jgi:hypothetical protein
MWNAKGDQSATHPAPRDRTERTGMLGVTSEISLATMLTPDADKFKCFGIFLLLNNHQVSQR